MSVEEFDRFNDNSLCLMFAFGIPIMILFFIFIFPELMKLPEPLGVIIGFLSVLFILFFPPKVSYFVLRKSNPYTKVKGITEETNCEDKS